MRIGCVEVSLMTRRRTWSVRNTSRSRVMRPKRRPREKDGSNFSSFWTARHVLTWNCRLPKTGSGGHHLDARKAINMQLAENIARGVIELHFKRHHDISNASGVMASRTRFLANGNCRSPKTRSGDHCSGIFPAIYMQLTENVHRDRA